ncbi:Penicillin-binding protein 1F [compost metagenome]
MSEQTAWYLTEMMQTVVEKGGTGVKAAIGRPLAGKTGTTQHGIKGYRGDGIKDAWFVGYTPEWTAAVWMGYDKTDMDHFLKTGGSQSAALFSKVMKSAMKNVPKSSFKQPQAVKESDPPVTINNFNAIYIPEEVKVQLSWSPLEEGDITYKVFRKEASETEFIHFVDTLTTKVDDMIVFPGMTYEYYVVAYDAVNDKESSPTPTIKVAIPETEIITDIPMETIPDDPNMENTLPPIDGTDDTIEETPKPSDNTTQPSPTPTPTPGTDNGMAEPAPSPGGGAAEGVQNTNTGGSAAGGNT